MPRFHAAQEVQVRQAEATEESLMLIRLGTMTFRDLRGKDRTVTNEIERETEKAILLRRETYGKTTKIWIPKSVCNIRERPKIRIHNGQPIELGAVKEIQIADWWYEKEGVR
jgi:hypothetical protein